MKKEWWRHAFERQMLDSQSEAALQTLVDTQAMSVVPTSSQAFAEMARRSQRYAAQKEPSLLATSDRAVRLLNESAQHEASRRGQLGLYVGEGREHSRLHVGEPVRIKTALATTRGLLGDHAFAKTDVSPRLTKGTAGVVEQNSKRRALLNRGGVTVRFGQGAGARRVHFTPERAAATLELGYAARARDLPVYRQPLRFAQLFIDRQAGWMSELAVASRAFVKLEVVTTRSQIQGLGAEVNPSAKMCNPKLQRFGKQHTHERNQQQEYGL